jgi:hypothetical protein
MRTGTFTRPNEIDPVQRERGTQVQRRRSCCSFGTAAMHTCHTDASSVPFVKKAATPWGEASLVEELKLAQQAGDKRFSSLVQLLETPKGERLVRFAYATDGTARRGPVTFRLRDLERLRAALERCPGLREALRL